MSGKQEAMPANDGDLDDDDEECDDDDVEEEEEVVMMEDVGDGDHDLVVDDEEEGADEVIEEFADPVEDILWMNLEGSWILYYIIAKLYGEK